VRRVRIGAVTEDDVQQQHCGLPPGGQVADRLQPQGGVDHRVRAAHGQGVVPEVDDDVTRSVEVRPEVELGLQRGVRADVAEHRRGQQHRLVGERAPGVEALQGRARNRGFGRSRARRPGGHVQAHVPQQRFDGGGQIRCLGRQGRGTNRHREFGCRGLDGSGHGRRGGLGHQHHPLGGRVGVQGGERVERREPADGLREVAAPDTEDVRDADPGHVEQAGDLLGAGARRGDQADRPGADDVGEAERDAGDDRRPAVGAHDEDAGVVGGPLQRDLVLDGDAVGEDQHAAAGGDRVGGLRDGVRAGHRDDRERRRVRGELGQPGADGALRDGGRGAGRPLASGERGVHGGHRRGQGGVVLGPDGDEQLLGRGVLVRGQPHSGRELEVQRCGHGDQHRADAVKTRDLPAHLHQPDGVGVDARAERDRPHSGRGGRDSRGR
jgi:hypothetical protein